MPVRIAYGELELGKTARKSGGKWDSDGKLWYIPYGKVKGPELEAHMTSAAKGKKP